MFELIVLLVLLIVGFGAGRYFERRHYKSIHLREDRLRRIPAVTVKGVPREYLNHQSVLVTGSVVVSVDYFKRFLASLRLVVGGRLRSYETLLDRARREALLRMKADADLHHADIIFNVRLETASISKGERKTLGSVEVLAFGTALVGPR